MFQAPDVTANTTLEFQLLVKDDDGASDTDTIKVTINNVEGLIQPTEVEVIDLAGEMVEAAKDQVLVCLDEDITPEDFDAVRARADALSVRIGSDLDLRILQLVIDSSASEEEIIDNLKTYSGVAGADLNRLVEVDDISTLDNAEGYLRWQKKGDNPGNPSGLSLPPLKEAVPPPSTVSFDGDYWINTIGAPDAWRALSAETLGENKIAVVDTGLPAGQDAIASTRVMRFDEKGNDLTDDDTPGETHGLWVAAFAAGYADGAMTRRGVNPHSDLIFVDVK